MHTLQDIAQALQLSGRHIPKVAIYTLLTDSRKLVHPESSLFFALPGPRRDGHLFIPELYKAGLRYFVVSEKIISKNYPDAVFLEVDNVLTALQKLAAFHRSQFETEVIGITGSNGKTIVKEWIYQLLQAEKHIVRSPKSYNSQIGVPLSVWEIEPSNDLALFEAGISQRGEMQQLQEIIQPTIGVITNIGSAHSEGFKNNAEKLKEKLLLFKNSRIIIADGDDPLIKELVDQLAKPIFYWGRNESFPLQVVSTKKKNNGTEITLKYSGHKFSIQTPFTDTASIENIITACAVALYLETDIPTLQERIPLLQPVNMRLEFKKGNNNCILINDSYSTDIDSLSIALHFLQQQAKGLPKTVILSDFLQAGSDSQLLYQSILDQLQKHKIARFIGIGEKMQLVMHSLIIAKKVRIDHHFFLTTADFIQHLHSFGFKDEAILIKGGRVFEFEQIASLLEQKAHQTILEINLNAIAHNYKTFQQLLQPSTKVMVMVKAFAYGSGGTEVAGLLQYHKADYLGVAYADEGVEIRKAGISIPVMVLNPELSAFDVMTEHLPEPDLFSFEQLDAFEKHIQQSGLKHYPVHIEIETGMNRLGFATTDVPALAQRLKNNVFLKVQSVFSHLAASEDVVEDAFTLHQYKLLKEAAIQLKEGIGYDFLTHIANSSAIARFPKLQMDMVRLGIGLYGIAAKKMAKKLQPALTLKSTIAQLKQIQKGETVSYNRRGVAAQNSTIATVRIGYADGYSRRLSNGVGYMLVHGKKARVIGTVCMDMVMIDVTHIKGAKEGDDVIVFGKGLTVEELAQAIGTIPYEIMTGISQRVKRVYWSE